MPDQVNEDDGEGEEGEEEGDAHVGGHAQLFLICICRADDNGVNGAEQADDHEGDRCADAAQQGVDCAKARALFRVINSLAEHEVGDVDQLGDGGGGETWIPCPPGVPGGARPDGAKHDGDEEEHGAHFHCGDFKAVPFHIFGDEIDDA